jgi:hypothetical protein
MRRMEHSAYWIVLLALLGVYYVPSRTTSAAKLPEAALQNKPTDRGQESSSKGSTISTADPEKPLLDFLSIGSNHDRDLPHPDLLGYQLEFLIATVPDPIDTAFAYRFDSVVDATQQALQTQGYVLDRWQFPWSDWKAQQAKDRDSEGNTDGNKQADTNCADGSNLSPRFYERTPGVLLFRNAHAKSLLMLFLVGESPTRGIHKRAFTKSLDVVVKYKGLHVLEPIRIIGPYFSGSQASLQLAIKQWSKAHQPLLYCSLIAQVCAGPILYALRLASSSLDPSGNFENSFDNNQNKYSLWNPWFRIISGSATSINKPEFVAACHPASVSFHATILPETLLRRSILDYLQLRIQDPCKKVAMLTEWNTGYGSGVINQQKAPLDNPICRVVNQDKAPPDNPIIMLPFPLHVSELRTAYQKDGVTESNLPRLSTASSRLRIPLEGTRGARDTEPSLSNQMDAVTAELMLSQILSTISHEEIRYVGITATDPRDKIFLAGLIRDYCPDVQLFTTHADLLLSHPQYSYCLRGTVIASTYPLYSKNQLWSFPFMRERRRVLFENQSDQGVYNATLALRGKYEQMLEYGPPFQEISVGAKLRPPVWISVVGQHGIYPVDVIASYPIAAGNQDRDKEDQQHEEAYVFCPTATETETAAREVVPYFTGLWLSAFVAMSLFCLAVCWSYLRGMRKRASDAQAACPAGQSTDGCDESGPLTELFTRRSDKFVIGQQWYLGICFSCLLLPCQYFAGPCIFPLAVAAATKGWANVELLRGAAIVGMSLLALVTWLCLLGGVSVSFWSALSHSFENLAKLWRLVFLLAVLALLISPLVAVLVHMLPPSTGTGFLLFERTVNLQAGVSGLVPVCFLGIGLCCWSFCQLKRLYLLDCFSVDTPFPANGHPAFDRIRAAQQQIEQVLGGRSGDGPPPKKDGQDDPPKLLDRVAKSTLLQPSYHLIVWVLVGFALLRLGHRFLPTPDGPVFDFMIMAGFAFLAFLLVYKFLQLLLLWRRVKRLLHDIALLPMLKAFDRLPGKVSSVFRGYFYPRRQRNAHLAVPRHLFEILRKDYKAVQASLPFVVHVPGSRSDDDGQKEVSQERLSDASEACLRNLACFWPKLPLNAAYGDPPAADGKPSEPEASAGIYPIEDKTISDQLRRWLHNAQEFVAIEAVTYLRQFFVHLRNLTTFLTIGMLLLLLAVNSYPFQPQRLLMMFLWTLILSMMGGVVVVLVQMNRDELLCRISGSTPNRFTLDRTFIFSVVKYIVPLVALLVTQFADVSDLLYTWIEPVIRILK